MIEFKSIFDFIRTVPDEASCIQYLEEIRWAGNVISPFDETSKVYKCANNKYKCKNSGLYFNVRTGTIFESSKIELTKWFMAMYIFSSHVKGISSYQLAKDIGITQKSAWFLLHRLRFMFNHPTFKIKLQGIIEIDEAYIGGDDKNKHEYKKTHKRGRNNDTKIPVIGLLQREVSEIIERPHKIISGKIVKEKIIKSPTIINCNVVSNTTADTIHPIIKSKVETSSTIITDEYKSYIGLEKAYQHAKVNHSAKEFVNNLAHTNGIECFWSHLKRMIDGIYHWVSMEHLQAYVNEEELRYNSSKLTTNRRFDLILENMEGRLTYKALIA